MANQNQHTLYLGILLFEDSLKSAAFGIEEALELTNHICNDLGLNTRFEAIHISEKDVKQSCTVSSPPLDYLIFLPSLVRKSNYLMSSQHKAFVIHQFENGCTLCSVCAGAFLLAQTGLIRHQPLTTHWGLAAQFKQTFPDIALDEDKILISQKQVISAGGLMAWTDLVMHIVAQRTSATVMRMLGKQLVLDTGHREQSFYRSFQPNKAHSDKLVSACQNYLEVNAPETIRLSDLPPMFNITQRTLARRFVRATGFNLRDYLQRVRIQLACEQLETSNNSIEAIAWESGYRDVKGFRKIFENVMGITPSDFRKRFMR